VFSLRRIHERALIDVKAPAFVAWLEIIRARFVSATPVLIDIKPAV